MNFKNNPLKLFVIVFTLLLFFVFVGSFFLRSYYEKKYPDRFLDCEVVEDGYDRSFPQIVNLPVRNINLGENFTYTPRVAPEDSLVTLSLLEGPEWLNWEDGVIYGVPERMGQISFTLRLEKEGRYVDQEFFLIINGERNE